MTDSPDSPSKEIPTKKQRTEGIPTSKTLVPAKKLPPGTLGDRVSILANYFEISFDAEKIFQHRIDFEPEIFSKGTRRALVHELTESQPEVGKNVIFDGFYTLFSSKKINSVDTPFRVVTKGAQKQFDVRIKFTNTLADPDDRSSYSEEETKKFLNIHFRTILIRDLKLQELRRNYFDKSGAKVLPTYELWPGFKTSMNIVDKGKLFLCADLTWKVMHTTTVLDYLNNRKNDNSETDPLVGKVIICKYNNRTYNVDGVAFDLNPRSTFSRTHKGVTTQISYVQYFEERHNIRIRVMDQPLLLSISEKRTAEDPGKKKKELLYLIPELSYMTGVTEDIPRRDLITHTRVDPPKRYEQLERFSHKVAQTFGTVGTSSGSRGGGGGRGGRDDEWRLAMNPRMVEIQGRMLPMQRIFFGNNVSETPDRAQWQLQNRLFVNPVKTIDRWLVIYNDRDRRNAEGFMQTMQQDSQAFGFRLGEPKSVELRNARAEAFVQAITEHLVRPDSFNFVVCILPSNNAGVYGAIKQQLLIRTPVPSQCIVARTLDGTKRRSVCTKLAQQMQAKLGATLWTLEFSGPIIQKPTMVVGIDVSTAKEKRTKRSVGAFCATMNSKFTQYFSRVDFIPREQEIVSGLGSSLKSAIESFIKTNNTPPLRIVVFRDGVGDGQHQSVLEFEIPQFKQVFQEISDQYNKPYSPSLCFILVKKRISTRLFSKGHQGVSNPRFGTVIDTTITTRSQFDFFLITQNVGNMGSVSPTRYHVLYNDTDLQADDVQLLAFKMSYLYYNWNGTIAVPAPVQYAHKLSFLASTAVNRSPHESLKDKLYFL